MSEEQTQEAQPQEEQQTIEVPQEYADERPKWLPEKFKTPEDLANSYANLESKFGQKEDEIRNSVMKEIEEKRILKDQQLLVTMLFLTLLMLKKLLIMICLTGGLIILMRMDSLNKSLRMVFKSFMKLQLVDIMQMQRWSS